MTMNYSLITHVETQKQRFLEGSSEDVSGSFNGRGQGKKITRWLYSFQRNISLVHGFN